MLRYMKAILIALVAGVMVLAMTCLVGVADGAGDPCPDFFYQDPLPISDWPVVASADADTAWAVSLGSLMVKTDDGGKNRGCQWSELQRDPDTPPLHGISVVNSQVAWICGDGDVLATSDVGDTWSNKSISVASQDFRPLGISVLSDQVAGVVGQEGSVYRTTDGGTSWNRKDPAVGRTSTIERIKAFDMNNVYAIGNSGSFFSTGNGGG